MKKTLIKTVAALSLSAMTLVALPAVPAYAGSLSISLAPTDAESETLMRTGLALFGLVQGAQNGGHIGQYGHNNAAGLQQNGAGNLGLVHQEGNGHNGTVSQNGNNNAYGLFQFGENTNGHAVQHGNGGTGATFQFGW